MIAVSTHNRRRPARARAGARADADRDHSEPRRPGGSQDARRTPARADRRTVRALSRQARTEQGHVPPRRRRRAAPGWTGRSSMAGDGPELPAIAAEAARSGRDIRLIGWVDQRRRRRLARPRVDADLPVERSRVAQPRADRSKRARHADRRDEHRRHARHRRRTERRDCSPTLPRGSPMTCDGCGRTKRCGAGSARRRAHAPTNGSTRPSTTARIERSTASWSGRAAHELRPIRVAIVARSVFPLHGHGGLERHVYDLDPVPGGRGPGRHADHQRAVGGSGGRPRRRCVDPSVDRPPHRALSDVPFRRTPRHDDPRSQHAPIRCSASVPGASRWISSSRGEIDIVHGLGASVLGYARQRKAAAAPLVLNPQGLEEFGATDPSRARLKRLAYLPLRSGCHRVRAGCRPRHRDRPVSRSRRHARHLALPPDRSLRFPTRSTCRWLDSAWRRSADGRRDQAGCGHRGRRDWCS